MEIQCSLDKYGVTVENKSDVSLSYKRQVTAVCNAEDVAVLCMQVYMALPCS